VKETVRYAVCAKKEQDIMLTAQEMVFVGFLLLMVYHKLASEQFYRSTCGFRLGYNKESRIKK
jgi:hypothetical protein